MPGGSRARCCSPHLAGGYLTPGGLYDWYYPARRAAGRPDLRFHDLRHTGATLAAATGATIAELMRRLGHSTAQAAMRYQHATDDRDAGHCRSAVRSSTPPRSSRCGRGTAPGAAASGRGPSGHGTDQR